jgi:hypothetical protein
MRITPGGEVLFVRGDFETIYLRVGIAEDTRAYSGGGLPETDFVILTCRGEDYTHYLFVIVCFVDDDDDAVE